MNIEILAPYCATPKQKSHFEKLEKKLPLKREKDLYKLYELTAILYASGRYDGLSAFLPELLAAPFTGDFDLWYPVEKAVCLIAQIPQLAESKKEECLWFVKSPDESKTAKETVRNAFCTISCVSGASLRRWEEGLNKEQTQALDLYFRRYLSIFSVENNLKDLRDALDYGKNFLWQFWARFDVLTSASKAKFIDEQAPCDTSIFPEWLPRLECEGKALQTRMDSLIAEQIIALQDKKFKKYY